MHVCKYIKDLQKVMQETYRGQVWAGEGDNILCLPVFIPTEFYSMYISIKCNKILNNNK